jgi:hypothetical protein
MRNRLKTTELICKPVPLWKVGSYHLSFHLWQLSCHRDCVLQARNAHIESGTRGPTEPQGCAILASSDVIAFAAATDLYRARVFYEQALGLPVTSHA